MAEPAFDLANVSTRAATGADISALQSFILEHGPNPYNFLPPDVIAVHLEGLRAGTNICRIFVRV